MNMILAAFCKESGSIMTEQQLSEVCFSGVVQHKKKRHERFLFVPGGQ